MKKAALFVLVVCIIFNLNAQQNRFIGGILLDINGIGLLGNTGQYWNSSTENDGEGHGGISCGIFVKREITKKFYTTIELRYSTKGSYYEYVSKYGTDASESLYLNYLELPILMGYKFKPLKKTYYLECGLELSKLINAKIEPTEILSRIGTPDIKNIRSYDFLINGSIKFPLIRQWENNFLIGIRLTRSLLPIHKYYKIYNFEYGIEFNYIFN